MADASEEARTARYPGDQLSVLMYGMDYWPDETGIAPYTSGLAEYLVEQGHIVHMITGVPYYPSWKVAPAYQSGLRFQEAHNGVRIERFRQYVPSRQSALRRLVFEGSFVLNAIRVKKPRTPVDVVIGVIPSLGSGALAAIMARRLGVPLVLIVQDLMGQAVAQSGIERGSAVAGLTAKAERAILRQADAVGIVAEGYRNATERLGVEPQRIHRVRNWTHIRESRAEGQGVRSRLGIPGDSVFCLHAGNMGLKQGLDHVIRCAEIASGRGDPLLFVFMGGGNQRARLMEQAAALPNVMFLEHQPEADFPDILAAADVLIINQRPSVSDMSLPSKLTSYFVAGRPVVAAVGADSETAREIAAAGGGVVVDPQDPQAMIDALLAYAKQPEWARETGERGRQFAASTLTASAALSTIGQMVLDAARSNVKAGTS